MGRSVRGSNTVGNRGGRIVPSWEGHSGSDDGAGGTASSTSGGGVGVCAVLGSCGVTDPGGNPSDQIVSCCWPPFSSTLKPGASYWGPTLKPGTSSCGRTRNPDSGVDRNQLSAPGKRKLMLGGACVCAASGYHCAAGSGSVPSDEALAR